MNTRKAINYDLYDKALQQFYPKDKSYKNAWNDLKKFFYSKGFTDRQYSGVVSIEPMSRIKVRKILKEANVKFPWLKKCIRRIDMTSIESELDMRQIFVSKQAVASLDEIEPLDLKAYKQKAKEYNIKNRNSILNKNITKEER